MNKVNADFIEETGSKAFINPNTLNKLEEGVLPVNSNFRIQNNDSDWFEIYSIE